jgi:flagellar hook-associated protein 2
MLQIEGVDVENSSNTFTIDGITYSLKSESDSAINFSIERDTDAVFDKIVAFVDAYNTLIDDLQSKIDEEVYSDYERSPIPSVRLSESQQEKWDEKSKSGLLRNDSGIRSLLQTMRSAFYQTVADTGKSASSIGLQTGSYATTGKIVIDEDKLREAINSNPDEVAKLFTNVSTATDSSTKTAESGLVTRLSNALNNYVSNSVDNTLASNAKALSEANDRLDDLEDWLANNEEKYWSKFTAMESAMSKLNSQSSWLSSLLGS